MPAPPAPIAVEARALDDAVGPGPASPAGFGPALGWVLGVPDSPRRGCRPGRPVDLAEGVRLLTGVRAEVGPEARTLRFGVTKHRVTLAVHPASGLSEATEPGPGMVEAAWSTPEALDSFALGHAGRRLRTEAARLAAQSAGP